MKSGSAEKLNQTIDLFPHILKTLYRNHTVPFSQLIQDFGVKPRNLRSALLVLKNQGFILWDQSTADSLIALREDQVYFIGIDLGGTKLYGGISNLAGRILFDTEIRHNGKCGEPCYQLLTEVLDSLLEKAKSEGLEIRGIGVQVPGRVQLDTGIVIAAAAIKWEMFPLGERLASKYGLPVYVDNDLKQAALGEAWFGAGKYSSNVVLIAIGTGMGASVVANGVLQRGAHLRHGEIGWMIPGREFLGRHYEGFGALETEVSGSGIARRARALLAGARSEEELKYLTSEDVFQAARNGEVWAKQVVVDTVEYLAMMIANIMAFYDPDIIILSGGVSRSHDLLIDPILKLIEGTLVIPPNIVLSSLGYQAGVLGAVVNLLMNHPKVYQAMRL